MDKWGNVGSNPYNSDVNRFWITEKFDLYAKWTPITYTIWYELNGGILPAWQENPTTYTIESNDITLKNPTRIWYIFSWWTWTDLSTESTEVTIVAWSMWDRVYYANWQPDNVNVTVYYFTQKLNPSTNESIISLNDKALIDA